MVQPQSGSRVLVLKKPWLDLMLTGEKTLEVRGRKLKGGVYYLGSRGLIHGRAVFESAFAINDEAQWNALLPKHRVCDPALPYKRTFGLLVKKVMRITPPVAYVHPRGAIGIVKYRAP